MRRECKLRRVGHFANETIGQTASGLAGKFLGDACVVFFSGEQRVLVHLGRAALGTGQESGAELCRLRAERKHGSDAGAIHDAARGDDRDAHGSHDEAGQRERAGERIVGIAHPCAAVAARFAALCDDEVEARSFAHGFAHVEALARQSREVRRECPRTDALDRGELRFEIGCIGRLHALRRAEAELGIEMGHRGERCALVLYVAELGRGEEVDDERCLRAFAHPRGLLLHVCRLCVGEAEAAQCARRGAGGDQLLATRAAGHRRLDDRHAKAELGAQGGGDHAVSENSSRPISQRRISEVPAPIS